MTPQALSSFIWSVADLLRGDYKQSEYGRVILPFTVLRRLDCVLEATKPKVLAENSLREKMGVTAEPNEIDEIHALSIGAQRGIAVLKERRSAFRGQIDRRHTAPA